MSNRAILKLQDFFKNSPSQKPRLDNSVNHQMNDNFDPDNYRNPASSRRVYFISDGGYAIKIGVGSDPEDRLSKLQVGNAKKLKIIGMVRGSFELEAAIHRHFDANHVRGEWFRDTAELRAFIAKHRTDISEDEKPNPLLPPLRRRPANDNQPQSTAEPVQSRTAPG